MRDHAVLCGSSYADYLHAHPTVWGRYDVAHFGADAMPTQEDAMIDWCKDQQVLLLRIADRLESGAMITGEEQSDGTAVDTSKETLAQIRAALASLDRLLPSGCVNCEFSS